MNLDRNSVLYKIWRILYPLILYFLMDVVIVWAVQEITLLTGAARPGSFLADNTPAISSVIFLLVSILVFFRIYQNDGLEISSQLYRKPQYFAVLVLIGILASHGLSGLISLVGIDRLAGDYSQIEATVFAASPVLVILQTVILAPLSEELLFRGILYSRLRKFPAGFWPAALISSALFGLYHFNLAQGIFAFLFGLLLCAVYDKTRNLWACISLHMGGNLISVILVYAEFTYPELWICILVCLAALAAGGALYYFLIRPLGKAAGRG